MATKSLLLVPVTLCLLLVLAAQDAEATSTSTNTNILVLVYGRALCSSNPSTIISRATVSLVTAGNATVLATGETASTGRFFIPLNVTSTAQVLSLASSGVVTVAPPACGAPANAVVQARVSLNGYGVLGPTSTAEVLLFLQSSQISQQATHAASETFVPINDGRRLPMVALRAGSFGVPVGN